MSRNPAGKRPRRVAQRLHTELALLIQHNAADPRLELVTVTDIKVDRELEYANVWICTIDGSTEHKDDVLKALENAKGFFRSELAARVQLRHIPQLIFNWDYVPERAARIEKLIDSLDQPTSPHNEDNTSGSDL